jgi:PIN domain nuclease of toxin-antitoxin system
MSVIKDSGHRLFVSTVSAWEISVKRDRGKIDAPDDLGDMIAASGIATLDLSWHHAWAAGEIPLLHKDPFDRMIVAQARSEGMTLISADRRLGDYGVPMIVA